MTMKKELSYAFVVLNDTSYQFYIRNGVRIEESISSNGISKYVVQREFFVVKKQEGSTTEYTSYLSISEARNFITPNIDGIESAEKPHILSTMEEAQELAKKVKEMDFKTKVNHYYI